MLSSISRAPCFVFLLLLPDSHSGTTKSLGETLFVSAELCVLSPTRQTVPIPYLFPAFPHASLRDQGQGSLSLNHTTKLKSKARNSEPLGAPSLIPKGSATPACLAVGPQRREHTNDPCFSCLFPAMHGCSQVVELLLER